MLFFKYRLKVVRARAWKIKPQIFNFDIWWVGLKIPKDSFFMIRRMQDAHTNCREWLGVIMRVWWYKNNAKDSIKVIFFITSCVRSCMELICRDYSYGDQIGTQGVLQTNEYQLPLAAP